MIKDISIIFISIFFESMPFLLLGAIISSIIEVYVSNDTIEKLIPKNKVLGSIVGVILGFFIPACDCAVIPVSKRLLKKNVPINVSVSFLLASPIVNPVVLLSTYSAFYSTNSEIFWYRLVLGILISLVIGIIMGIIFKDKDVTLDDNDNCHFDNCCHDSKDDFGELEKYRKGKRKEKALDVLRHVVEDFFDVIKYLIFGALLASIFEVVIPRNILMMFNDNKVISILILMIFAYLLSLCSTSDSFVGKSLLASFSKESIIAYLLLGPMIDIKNTIVLLGNFSRKFTIVLISLIFICVFIFSMVVVNI